MNYPPDEMYRKSPSWQEPHMVQVIPEISLMPLFALNRDSKNYLQDTGHITRTTIIAYIQYIIHAVA